MRLIKENASDVDSSAAKVEMSKEALELSVQGSIRKTNKALIEKASKYGGITRQSTEAQIPCQQSCYRIKRLRREAGGPTALNVDHTNPKGLQIF